MTLASETNRANYACSGGTVYPFPYYFFQDSDLVVYRSDAGGGGSTLTLNVDYTVTGIAKSKRLRQK